MNRRLALPSADLQSTGRGGGIYITATINKSMYVSIGWRTNPTCLGKPRMASQKK